MSKKIFSMILALTIFFQLTSCLAGNKKTSNNTPLIGVEESEEDLAAVLEEIEKLKTYYNYPYYYFSNSKYNSLVELVNSTAECENQDNYEINDIWEKILNNSNISTNSKEEVYKNLAEALHQALNNCFNNSNIGDDFCKLSNLKIEIKSLEVRRVGEYHNNQNLIYIDYHKIKSAPYSEEIGFLKYLTQVIEHELNHARQYICDCKENKQQNETAFYEHETGLFSFLLESSAESQVYSYEEIKEDKKNTFQYTYKDERRLQSLLLIMGLFKDDFTIDKYYNAINNSNLEELHKLFKLETKEDLETFYNIIYSMNTLTERTVLWGYLNLWNEDEQRIKEAVGVDYLIDIFKVTIKDLIKRISKDNLSLSESLIMYNYVKANIVSHNYELNSELKRFYDEELITGIGTIEDIFYAFISNYFNISKKVIYDFDPYLSGIVDDLANYYNYISNSNEKKFIIEDFIKKYPLIQEISFCNISYFSDCILFNESRKDNLVIKKHSIISKSIPFNNGVLLERLRKTS